MKKSNSSPSLDAVLVWITFTVERDHIERGVFPQLRAERAVVQHGSSSLHYMDQESVRPLLADAKARAAETRKGLLNAYNAFIRSLQRAIQEASERRAIFEAPAAVCTHKHECYSECWRGTKEHLKAIGVSMRGPWPGEEGGRERWAKTSDAKGRIAIITEYSKIWRGLYEVRIEIPEREQKLRVSSEEREKKRVRAQANLDAMLNHADDFRMKLVEDIRRWLAFCIKTETVDYHGFTLSEEAAEDILMSCDAVVEAALQAKVHFDAKRHQQIRLKYQQELAEADESFQHLMYDITAVRVEVAEGDAT